MSITILSGVPFNHVLLYWDGVSNLQKSIRIGTYTHKQWSIGELRFVFIGFAVLVKAPKKTQNSCIESDLHIFYLAEDS